MKSELKNIKGKSLPYYSTETIRGERELARDLRKELVPKLERRLPGHHLNGLRHDYIVNFVRKCKKNYPYFLKADIKKFYPSVRHLDIVTGFQIAYRDLLSMKYVPGAFKKKYVRPVNEWTKLLPLTQGIPLGSPLSAILAPMMLIPMWLHIKRTWNVPMVIYMDDVLIMTQSVEQCNAIYVFIENYLVREFNLYLNLDKVLSGKLSAHSVEFCGWRFATSGTANVEKYFVAGVIPCMSC